jgi:putative ubiquitin-RnfH superfamily antitoxin RatB of RatAB toxin-antitoxin module
VVYALPAHYRAEALQLPVGSTVADALDAAAEREAFAALDLRSMPVGIFGERVERTRRLADGDRVELYRPLQVDPREARRQRSVAGDEKAPPPRSSIRDR